MKTLLVRPNSQQQPSRRGVASINHFAKNQQLNLVNPATGKQLKGDVKVDSEGDIKQKFASAVVAQKKWSLEPLEKRKEVIARFNSNLKQKVEELASTLTSEMGKPLSQARNEVTATSNRISFFLENVDSVVATSTRRATSSVVEQVRHEPLGVVANISAWNYPFFVGVNAFIPALLTGNAVLYKPSEHVTLTGLSIVDLMLKSGLPADLFSAVVGGGETARQLLSQPVDGVFFTGSYKTGAKIAEQMAGRMVPVQLELGGKDPTYVCEDVDVEKAVKSLADGAFYNTGQSCCSVERIYVHSDVYKQFVDMFVEEVKTFKAGDPLDKDTYIGPLTLPSQPAFLAAQVSDAVSKGAKVLLGGKVSKNPSYFEPTVLVDVNHTMDVMTEESFGPIIGIQQVKGDDEALRLMNDCKYGLTAGVYTKNKERAETLLSGVNSGTVYWNACDRVSPYVPWNGRKWSGIGSTLGREGILAFTKPKSWHLVG